VSSPYVTTKNPLSSPLRGFFAFRESSNSPLLISFLCFHSLQPMPRASTSSPLTKSTTGAACLTVLKLACAMPCWRWAPSLLTCRRTSTVNLLRLTSYSCAYSLSYTRSTHRVSYARRRNLQPGVRIAIASFLPNYCLLALTLSLRGTPAGSSFVQALSS
jgi:hypothetical protein